jgi:hypothetical protein
LLSADEVDPARIGLRRNEGTPPAIVATAPTIIERTTYNMRLLFVFVTKISKFSRPFIQHNLRDR